MNPLASMALDGRGKAGIIGWEFATMLVFVVSGEAVATQFDAAADSVLLTSGLVESIDRGVRELQDAGAMLLAGGQTSDEAGFRYPSTLLMSNGRTFREMPSSMQRELFGPAGMIRIRKHGPWMSTPRWDFGHAPWTNLRVC